MIARWTAFIAAALLLQAAPVRAWGPVGHRAVGLVAERHLSPEARKQVRALLGAEGLARASTWADEMRSHPDRDKFKRFDPWHYATVPSGEKYLDEHAPEAGDVVQAMRRMEAVLRDKKAGREEKIEALRLLAHFVGDIHQPLHVGGAGDMGGNLCWVRWFGKPTRLHALWDDGLIDHMKLSFTELADFLGRPTAAERKLWQSASYADWADESIAIRLKVYPGEPGADGKRAYCVGDWNARPPESDMPDLSWRYAFDWNPVIERRLLQAGVRLAGVLNAVYAGR